MKPSTTMTRPEGSQSIARAVELLSHVAASGDAGTRLTHVVQLTGLHVATARRILQALVAEGLLAFDPRSKVYAIGPAIFSFAVKGHSLFSHRELFMPALDNIARRTQDTVLFSLRSGIEAVCLARREGTFPIRVMSLEEGSRRPLGAGSGSLAILAFLPADQRAAILAACDASYGAFGLSGALVSKGVAEARRSGFSFNPGHIIEGVFGIGVPILREGAALASISVAAIAGRMGPARREEIVGIIREELAAMPDYEVPGAGPASAKSGKVA